ncbi:hypothetical protein [Soonwooa sp.]|uniref:hypothetical protein n=1 Tax=Soonwooa sp. TaxID=1938592 RepID=UPI00289A2A63|nr:hypothetical protein [Soonwooa sp.]
MAYKKSSPSLQDSIEVFVDQIQMIDETSKRLNQKSNEIVSALKEVENISIKPDLRELDQNLITFQNFANSLTTELNKQKSEFENIVKKSNSSSFYSFITILVCVVITVTSIYFSIRSTFDKKDLNNQLQSYKKIGNDLGTFVKEKGLENDFYKFQDQQRKK